MTPGGLSEVLRWSLATLPRSARTRVRGRVTAGMTGAGAYRAGTTVTGS